MLVFPVFRYDEKYLRYIQHCLYIYIYIYIYIYSAFVGLDNKLYKVHDTYIKIRELFIVAAKCYGNIYFVILKIKLPVSGLPKLFSWPKCEESLVPHNRSHPISRVDLCFW